MILCNTGAGVFTLTLPTAAESYHSGNGTGQVFTIKRITTDTNTVTISPPGVELVDGAATVELVGPGLTSVAVISDGSNWYQIA